MSPLLSSGPILCAAVSVFALQFQAVHAVYLGQVNHNHSLTDTQSLADDVDRTFWADI